MNVIQDAQQKGLIPEETTSVVDLEVIQNVLDDGYHSRIIDDADYRQISDEIGNDYDVADYITKQAMDLPLETIPVATNLLGILTSPYIAKKANIF